MAYERKFKIGKPILEVNNISLAFGGVKAITDTSFNVLEHEVRKEGNFQSFPQMLFGSEPKPEGPA